MVSEKFKKIKKKLLELVKLGKSTHEIFDEMNKEGKVFNSFSEVRRWKHLVKEEE